MIDDLKTIREALGFYADKKTYEERKVYRGDGTSGFLDWTSSIQEDSGEIARKALRNLDACAVIENAPELLAVLEELMGDYAGGASCAFEDDYIRERALAAITKARGES